jgi:hypothetical protein
VWTNLQYNSIYRTLHRQLNVLVKKFILFETDKYNVTTRDIICIITNVMHNVLVYLASALHV